MWRRWAHGARAAAIVPFGLAFCVVCLGAEFNDEATVARALKAAKAALDALPNRHMLMRDPEAFGKREILEPVRELGAVLDLLRMGLREKDASPELMALRGKLRGSTQAFLDEFEGYKAVYRSALTSERTLQELKKNQPPKGQTPSEVNKYNTWLAKYNAAVAEKDRQWKHLDAKHPKTVEACRKLIADLEQAEATLKEIQQRQPAATEKSAAEKVPQDPLSGRVEELLTRGACKPDEFHAAVKDGRTDFLEGLAGRLVIWQALLLEAPLASAGRVSVKLMAGRGQVTAEFPLGCQVEALKPGSSVVIAGHIRKADDVWLLHAVAWGIPKKLDAGEPMTRCQWPQESN